jgi:hypothetical protein
MNLKLCLILILLRVRAKEIRIWKAAKDQEKEEWQNPPEIPVAWDVDGTPVLNADFSQIHNPMDSLLAHERYKRHCAHLPEKVYARLHSLVAWEYRNKKEASHA